MEYIEGMSERYAGGDPDELLRLARVLADAAADLQRLQVRAEWAAGGPRMPAESAVLTARVRVWTAAQSEDVRRRARELEEGRWLHFDRPGIPPLAGGQHGRNRQTLSEQDAQLERARAIKADPNASEAERKAADDILNREGKRTGDRRNRQKKDSKPPPSNAAGRKEAKARRAAQKAAKKAAAAGAAAVGVWWAGKLLSPACGPAVLVCAAVL